MTPFEWLAVGYFVTLAAAPRTTRSLRGMLSVCGAIALVIVARFTLPWGMRAWLPHVYLLLGYWIPAAFAPRAPNESFERWLVAADARLTSHVPFMQPAWSRDLPAGILELAYLLCYPLVPAACAVVFWRGTTDDVVRFWLAVLTAGYLCYGTLPWTTAPPPRLREEKAPQSPGLANDRPQGSLAGLNAHVLGQFSHQLVTFPSGHVAVSIAAAAAVAQVSPAAGAGFGVLALLIAAAAVAGRYHYLIDAVLGLLVGAVCWGVTELFV